MTKKIVSSRSPTVDLTIIIVNFNGQFWLKKCLDSLKEYWLDTDRLTTKVVVVDNASSDDSVKIVKQTFKWVEVIRLPENRGFAAGNNVALKQADSKYVMLLNSDTELDTRSNLSILTTILKRKPKVGIVTPRLELTSGKIDPACHRGEPTLWASFSYLSGLARLFPSSKLFNTYHLGHLDTTTAHAVDACSGAAMVLRTRDLTKVGLLDEQFFMYAEDLDWCHRFREAGFEVWYQPDVVITHHKHKSGISSLNQPLKDSTGHFFYQTMVQYFEKHYQDTHPRWVHSLVKLAITLKQGAA